MNTSKTKRTAPYSLQHVHCAHCEPCQTVDCLKTDSLRRRCPSATRRDDLKTHTQLHHKGKTPHAVGDERPRTPQDLFRFFRPATQNDTSDAIASSPPAPSPPPLPPSTPPPLPPSTPPLQPRNGALILI